MERFTLVYKYMSLPPFEKPDHETRLRMQRILQRGSCIEKTLSSLLRSQGIRFRSQPKLKGKPDFRISGTRILVFCDSSFWHGRWVGTKNEEKHTRNASYWTTKLLANKKRDRTTSRNLRRDGWIVLRLWDDDILKHPTSVIRKIRKALAQAI